MIILLLGLVILIVAVIMLCWLLREEKTALNISVVHKILPNGVVEVGLEALSVLWMDQPVQVHKEAINKVPKSKIQETVQENTEWHNSDDFIQFLINCISERLNQCSGNNFAAFSFNGIVYLTPSALWSYITLYTKAKSIKGIEDKETIMLVVVQSMKKRGLVKIDDIQEGNYTATYHIAASKRDSKLKPKGVYIPIIAKYFNTDNKKEGILTFISNIEPYKEAANAE